MHIQEYNLCKGQDKMKKVLNWLWQKAKIIAKRSWENNKKVHKKALMKSENWLRLFIAILIFVIFTWGLMTDTPRIGLSFLFAGAMAIYAGYIYKGEEVMGYVLVGVLLAAAIPGLLPGLSESYKNGDFIGMLILILFGIFIWYYSSRLKKGEIPTFDDSPTERTKPKKGGNK